MTKPIDTDSIWSRLGAATSATSTGWEMEPVRFGSYQVTAPSSDENPAYRRRVADGMTAADADLIAHAPTDLAALVAEVRTLRDRLDAAERVVEAAEALNVEMDSLIIGGLSTPGQHAASALGAALDAWRGGEG